MKLILPGDPIAQIRMRYSGRNGIGRMYDPRAKEKTLIKSVIKDQWIGESVLHNPRVSFVFHMPIPKSIPKKLIAIYQSGMLKHEKKPDVDNLVKLYLDCMDTMVFDGDQSVCLGPCVKLYHPYPKTLIIINETEAILSPLEVDLCTWFALFGRESGRCSDSETASLDGFYTPDALIPVLSHDMFYPQQAWPSSETTPLARDILALSESRLREARSHKAASGSPAPLAPSSSAASP